ncbi:MAG: hypothetical protein V4510_04110 [bacterium]
MNENRIRVRLEPEMTPVRLEDKMDLHAEIQVAVDSHLTGLAVFGMVAIAVGILGIVAGAVYFVSGYPDKYHAANGVTVADSHNFIESIVLLMGSGIVLLFFGASAFFYGRTVLGQGSLDQFTDSDVEVQ